MACLAQNGLEVYGDWDHCIPQAVADQWHQGNPHFHVPANAIVFTAHFTMVISLINFGSTIALDGVRSLVSAAMTGIYVFLIGCITFRRFMRLPFPESRWSLGKAGIWVNCMVLLYATWAFVWSFFPDAYVVTPKNFN